MMYLYTTQNDYEEKKNTKKGYQKQNCKLVNCERLDSLAMFHYAFFEPIFLVLFAPNFCRH
jgi:hypothetical protein